MKTRRRFYFTLVLIILGSIIPGSKLPQVEAAWQEETAPPPYLDSENIPCKENQTILQHDEGFRLYNPFSWFNSNHSPEILGLDVQPTAIEVDVDNFDLPISIQALVTDDKGSNAIKGVYLTLGILTLEGWATEQMSQLAVNLRNLGGAAPYSFSIHAVGGKFCMGPYLLNKGSLGRYFYDLNMSALQEYAAGPLNFEELDIIVTVVDKDGAWSRQNYIIKFIGSGDPVITLVEPAATQHISTQGQLEWAVDYSDLWGEGDRMELAISESPNLWNPPMFGLFSGRYIKQYDLFDTSQTDWTFDIAEANLNPDRFYYWGIRLSIIEKSGMYRDRVEYKSLIRQFYPDSGMTGEETTPQVTVELTMTPTRQPCCTPPACSENETYYCPGFCLCGCGTICKEKTPTPEVYIGPPEVTKATLYVANMNVGYAGEAKYTGIYNTLFVGINAKGDWPHCSGSIERMAVQSLTQDIHFVEEFDDTGAFQQLGNTVYITDGKVVFDHLSTNGGLQMVYRTMPAFDGPVSITVEGQVDWWENNCSLMAGIGNENVTNPDQPTTDYPGIGYGFFGGGCTNSGPIVWFSGANISYTGDGCSFTADGAPWIPADTPVTAILELR